MKHNQQINKSISLFAAALVMLILPEIAQATGNLGHIDFLSGMILLNMFYGVFAIPAIAFLSFIIQTLFFRIRQKKILRAIMQGIIFFELYLFVGSTVGSLGSEMIFFLFLVSLVWNAISKLNESASPPPPE